MGKVNSKDHVNESIKEIAEDQKPTPASEVIKKHELDNNMAFVQADAYTGNPYALLGSVIEIRKVDGNCPKKLNDRGVVLEFSATKILGAKVDEASKIKEPARRESVIVDRKLSSEISFLSYLSAHFKGEASFSVMVFDQNTGLIDRDDENWNKGLQKWKDENKAIIDDPEVCYLFVITGFVQKYIIRKRYVKYEGDVKAGGFGLNLNGELYTSNEDYALDIIFGLHPIIIKRPPSATKSIERGQFDYNMTEEDNAIFRTLNAAKLVNKIK